MFYFLDFCSVVCVYLSPKVSVPYPCICLFKSGGISLFLAQNLIFHVLCGNECRALPHLFVATEPDNYYHEVVECGRRCLLTGALGENKSAFFHGRLFLFGLRGRKGRRGGGRSARQP